MWLYVSVCACEVTSVRVTSVMSDSLQLHRLYRLLPVLLSPWNSPGKNIGVGCHDLLQEIFLTQGSNLHLLNISPVLASGFFTTSATWEALYVKVIHC